jgi:FtsP/CotA-like multicopper oxidase with cupredoxin domain
MEMAMLFLNNKSSRIRMKEAEKARQNRLEIVKALSLGEITKRDLFKWGVFTAAGYLADKNGLSPFARSAYAAVPTGTPRSPLFGATKFSQPMPRPILQPRIPMVRNSAGDAAWVGYNSELPACGRSWHNDYDQSGRTLYRNPVTGKGPCEGRPPGDAFAHQRWDEHYPKLGYVLSIGQVKPNTKFHPSMPAQNANSVWCFGTRPPGMVGSAAGSRTGSAAPALIKARYGEAMVCRIYNDLPVDRAANGGFGRNEISTHFHNAHNGAESDGAINAYHLPGTFYDYHWGTTLARRDQPSRWMTTDPDYLRKASGPDDGDGLVKVAGDFRELQGSMWFHDHRFFFTAENVHKGMFALCNYYSGPDRGREDLNDGINLQLPSGSQLPWGNTDFDVNLAISNPAQDQAGQMFFDIFDQDGFLGDTLLVNGAYYPYMEVLPRRYRFRTLNASMARFIQLALVVNRASRFAPGLTVPFHFIANDGNFVISPIKLNQLDVQGVAERYDIVVDFSTFTPGDTIRLVNILRQVDGRLPDRAVSIPQALAGDPSDPTVGPILEFRVVSSLQSVDNPAKTYRAGIDPDRSANLNDAIWTTRTKTLTKQIPIVAPVRTREIEFGRSGGGDSLPCIPDCGDVKKFPWSIKINGQAAHTANANRISVLIPKPGEVEHWTLVNGGGGWDHPIHLHFEEGITMNRGGAFIPSTELNVRKDVWRLRPGGRVTFQVTFGEYGGSYVSHCHNTTHEDFAMLLRYQLLSAAPGDPNYDGRPHYKVTQTPIPTADGILWKTPEILPEGDPRPRGST